MELSSSSVVLNLNPNTKTFGYQDVDVTVSTNYEAGYELTMSTADSSTDLKRDATLDSVNANISTLTATSPTTTGYTDSDFSNCTTSNCLNKWGYKNGLSNNYFPFTSGATILSNTIATNADTTTLRFAAKIDYDLPAGTYNNELIFTATANPITYGINYYNGYDTTTAGIIGEQNDSAGAASYITLSPKDLTTGNPIATPTRSTYTFAGWCIDNTDRTNVAVNSTIEAVFNSTNTKVTAYNNPGTVCNGTRYQTGDYLPLTPNDANNINIYAMWTPTTFDQAYVAASKSKATESGLNYYKMQDMTAAICDAVSPNQATILVDYRKNVPDYDGTTTTGQVNGTAYHVAKLQDNRCWMLDNLALNLNNQNVVNDLKAIGVTGANTNTTTAAINALKNGGGTDSDGLAQTGYAKTNWTTEVSYVQPLISRAGSCTASTYQCLSPYQDNNYTYNTVIDKYGLAPAVPDPGTADIYYAYGFGDYKIGNYYNYCAASAGSYCYSDSYTATNDAYYDICPSNWRLPRSGTVDYPAANYSEFNRLYNLVSEISDDPEDSTKALSFQTMLSTPVSGDYYPNNGGSALWQGVGGFFWSSSYGGNSTHIYQMTARGTLVSQNSHYRFYGRSVRCIAQN